MLNILFAYPMCLISLNGNGERDSNAQTIIIIIFITKFFLRIHWSTNQYYDRIDNIIEWNLIFIIIWLNRFTLEQTNCDGKCLLGAFINESMYRSEFILMAIHIDGLMKLATVWTAFQQDSPDIDVEIDPIYTFTWRILNSTMISFNILPMNFEMTVIIPF